MNLEIVNNIYNNLKENKIVQNFIKELSNYLENKNKLNYENIGNSIIEDILSKNKFTTGNKNQLRWNTNDIISKYTQKNSENISTEKLQEEINNMAKELLDKQNKNLEQHRKEGHLYMVTEELGDNRFLWDLTDAPKTEFEEVDIPKDLLDQATEGMVLKYTNGKYEYYSDDGFERAEKINSSSE